MDYICRRCIDAARSRGEHVAVLYDAEFAPRTGGHCFFCGDSDCLYPVEIQDDAEQENAEDDDFDPNDPAFRREMQRDRLLELAWDYMH